MTKPEAAEMLSLPLSANMDDVRARFQELYSDYHISPHKCADVNPKACLPAQSRGFANRL